MEVTLTFEVIDLLLFLLVAFLAGSFAAQLLSYRRSTRRSTLWTLVVGVIGAFVGQLIFRLLKIDMPDFLERGITLAEVMVATIGAILVLAIFSWRR